MECLAHRKPPRRTRERAIRIARGDPRGPRSGAGRAAGPATIRIDGRDHEAAAFRGPQGFATYCAVGDLWVTIEGSSDVEYRLRKVADRARLILKA